MAIDQLSINNLLLDNIPGAPPPEDTSNEEPIDPQQPNLTSTPDPTKRKAHRQVVGVEYAGGKCMANQLDGRTCLESTQNTRIYGVHFGPHMTFCMLSPLSSKP
jgi:hypothetical protein